MTEMTHPEGVDRERVASPARLVIAFADLARDVVAEVAPDQLPYFALVTAEWAAGKDPRRPGGTWSGGEIGSGGAFSVLGDVILPLLTGTAAQVLGAAGFAGLQRRRWRRRRPRPAHLVLDVSRIGEIRDACVLHGRTLGLNEAEATLLADAVQAVLRRTADGERS
ncbi:hypothetical protein [Amycolatopsis sp. Hca4]|uniref:hypothetical protein n=1 Tax=Amycolatopsis sp. Hca4 TaxID=2742131 RepID=UPI00159005B0|nr:hypothetical protein [Amycolatopsis sp. Hca4]QKV73754.1 hypothetical protein HUT10_08200 [Amycolatopsis sp. Hca4]